MSVTHNINNVLIITDKVLASANAKLAVFSSMIIDIYISMLYGVLTMLSYMAIHGLGGLMYLTVSQLAHINKINPKSY